MRIGAFWWNRHQQAGYEAGNRGGQPNLAQPRLRRWFGIGSLGLHRGNYRAQ